MAYDNYGKILKMLMWEIVSVVALRLLALRSPLVMHGVERGSHLAGGLAFITFSSCWMLGFRLPLLLSIH